MLNLGIRSLLNRRFVVALTVLSIALSVFLVIGVERLRTSAKESFARSASGIDLIVAARGDPVQILMGTVFGVGSAGPGIGWHSYEEITGLPLVEWAVPILLGDNHRGFPVVGTTTDYFDRFRYGGGKALEFASGNAFAAASGAVVGSEVAARFGYSTGTSIVNAHGAGTVAFDMHDEAPFVIVGVLAPTGTAVDRTVIVSVEGFDRLHRGSHDDGDETLDPFGTAAENNAPSEKLDYGTSKATGQGTQQSESESEDRYMPSRINAVYVGLTDRAAVLSVQRVIDEYLPEPLTAVLPNVALLQLWSITGAAEAALLAMAFAVALAGITGMIVMISASLDARRREFAILRSIGAAPRRIFALIVVESLLVTAIGIVLGLIVLNLVSVLLEPWFTGAFGFILDSRLLSLHEGFLVLAILVAGAGASILPAARVYRMTLVDGLAFRL